MNRLRLLLAAVLLVSSSPLLRGQVVTARLTGTVRDTTSAVLPGVTVVARNVDTGRTQQTVSLETGDYNFGALPPGRYVVSVELAGFKKALYNDVIVEVNQVARLDIVMQVGDVSEVIDVRETSPVLQTDASIVGTVISSTTTPNLPLNGRNFIQLTLLTPGVVTGDLNGFTDGSRGSNRGGRPFVNGNRKEANNFQLDGIDNNNPAGNQVTYQVNVDALQEVKIITNNAPAEFGNFQGGIVNATLKSGTNQLHGTAFEFLRNDRLNANAWSNNYQGLPKAALRHNVLGGTIGGPILRNRLFFFTDYQATRRRPGFDQSNITFIPEAYRRGDFSLLLAGKDPQQLFNPLTARKDPADPRRTIREPFAENRIPSNLANPVARALFSSAAYPVPTLPGLTQNFTNSSRQVLDNDQGDARFDWKTSARDDVSFRYSHGVQRTGTVNSSAILFGSSETSPFRAMMGSWTHTVGPRLMNEFRAGLNRIASDIVAGQDIGGLGTLGEALGIPAVNQPGPGLPQLNFLGAVTTIGTVRSVNDQVNTTFQIGNNLSIVRSRHLIKTGFLLMQYRTNAYFTGNSGQLGFFEFNGQYSRDLNNTRSKGSAIADFFLGYPSRMGRGNPPESGTWEQRNSLYAGFVQDDWRIGSGLTLNLGLRYEYVSPLVEIHDHQTNLDIVTGKQLFAGKDGNSRGLYEDYKKNWQPRSGFAWSLSRNTVVRGAYTLSGFMEGTGLNQRLPLNVPFFIEFEKQNSDPAVLGTPISQGFAGLDRPQDIYKGQNMRAWGANVQPALAQQWNLTVERQIGTNLTASLGYVGQHGTHLIELLNANQLRLGEKIRPFDRTFPQITAVNMTDTVGNQRYDALQASGRRRFSAGFECLASYAYSKVMTDAARGFFNDDGQAGSLAASGPNYYNRRPDWGPAHFDATHSASFSYLYDLPFGKRRRYLTSARSVVGAVVNDWTTSGIALWHTGMPQTINAPDVSGTNARSGSTRPDRIADGKGPRRVGPNDFWFDTKAFVLPAQGNFGNAGVGIVRGPGMTTLDVTLMKKFPLTEGRYFQFRAELFNLTNTPIFNAPVTNFSNAQFGRVVSAQAARQIQLGLKFVF